jgi:predicted XRE-type DNA-binding protein
LVANLQALVNNFEVAIERASLSEKSVDTVLGVMEPVARQLAQRGPSLATIASAHTKFSYEEQVSSSIELVLCWN